MRIKNVPRKGIYVPSIKQRIFFAKTTPNAIMPTITKNTINIYCPEDKTILPYSTLTISTGIVLYRNNLKYNAIYKRINFKKQLTVALFIHLCSNKQKPTIYITILNFTKQHVYLRRNTKVGALSILKSL